MAPAQRSKDEWRPPAHKLASGEAGGKQRDGWSPAPKRPWAVAGRNVQMQQITPQRKENMPDLHADEENEITMAHVDTNGAEKFKKSYFTMYQPEVQKDMVNTDFLMASNAQAPSSLISFGKQVAASMIGKWLAAAPMSYDARNVPIVQFIRMLTLTGFTISPVHIFVESRRNTTAPELYRPDSSGRRKKVRWCYDPLNDVPSQLIRLSSISSSKPTPVPSWVHDFPHPNHLFRMGRVAVAMGSTVTVVENLKMRVINYGKYASHAVE